MPRFRRWADRHPLLAAGALLLATAIGLLLVFIVAAPGWGPAGPRW
ncbi:hypothetical protein [Thermomonas brevis]|jgi:hypothetical protein